MNVPIGNRYQSELQSEHFDTIVIGSGIGGLAVAALLSKNGQKVLVLERHYTAGGFTHTFKRKGYEWDVGIHYIGEVHRPNSVLRRIFDDISNHGIEWCKMPDVYDRIIIGDDSYPLRSGKENFIQGLLAAFPSEENAIRTYVAMVFDSVRQSRSFFTERAMPKMASWLVGGAMRRRFLRYSDQTTREVLEGLTQDQRLIAVLTGQYGNYGLSPAESSFAIHAMVVRHYMDGGSYPKGGSAVIAQTILPVIEAAGGQVVVRADVDEVLVDNNRAVGVRMQNGDKILAHNVVSDAGAVNTFKHLLPKQLCRKMGYDKLLASVEPSVAHLCVYIGIDESTESLGLDAANRWVYPSENHEQSLSNYIANPDADFPVVYISFPSAKDTSWDARYPNKTTIEVITLAPYDWFEQWDGTAYRKRGEDYEALKDKMGKRLIRTLEEHVPQLRGKITYAEVSTPLSTKHFANYQSGEIYGLSHTPQRFRQSWLRPRTKVKNFFLTGQDIVTDGIGGALFSGVLTASAMLSRNVMKDVITRTN